MLYLDFIHLMRVSIIFRPLKLADVIGVLLSIYKPGLRTNDLNRFVTKIRVNVFLLLDFAYLLCLKEHNKWLGR